MDNIKDISSYKFKTLHKYMNPVYSILERNIENDEKSKREIIKIVIPLFFKRLREYREIPVDILSTKLGVSPDLLIKLENGTVPLNFQMSLNYSLHCGGLKEFELFQQKLHEFKNPNIKKNLDVIAREAFIRFGIKIPGTSISTNHQNMGTLVPLHKDSQIPHSFS